MLTYTPEQEAQFEKITKEPEIITSFNRILYYTGKYFDHHPSLDDFKKYLEDEGFCILIQPELYQTGINWNWQLLWYIPKDEWAEHHFNSGTFLYGDCGEYPTREIAEMSAIWMAFQLLKAGLKPYKLETNERI